MRGGSGVFRGGNNKGLIGSARKGRALTQLGSVSKDLHGGRSFGSTGGTYEGGKRADDTIASPVSAPQAPVNQTGPTPAPNTPGLSGPVQHPESPDEHLPTAPASDPGHDVTPWGGAMNNAKILLASALGAMVLASLAVKAATASAAAASAKIKAAGTATPPEAVGGLLDAAYAEEMHSATMLKMAMVGFGVAALAAMMAMSFGISLMQGQYAQTTAGLAFMIGGAGGMAAALMALNSCKAALAATEAGAVKTAAAAGHVWGIDVPASKTPQGLPQAILDAKAHAVDDGVTHTFIDGAHYAANNVTVAKIDPLAVSGHALMYITGAAAVVGLGVGMLAKPKTINSNDCPDHRCHDNSYRLRAPTPEERIVIRLLS